MGSRMSISGAYSPGFQSRDVTTTAPRGACYRFHPMTYRERAPKERLPTSAFVRECLGRIGTVGGWALDVPCGEGRHATLLASRGLCVVAADLDSNCLHGILQNSRSKSDPPSIVVVKLDATVPLPFQPQSFGLAVVVHPLCLDVLVNALPTVRSEGYLIFESFGAQGGNWRALPRPRQIAELLAPEFEALVYDESHARCKPEAVTVKGLRHVHRFSLREQGAPSAIHKSFYLAVPEPLVFLNLRPSASGQAYRVYSDREAVGLELNEGVPDATL
jgi:SAM-dependent methyltransferase